MSNLAKLALAVVIAAVAGGLNLLYLRSKTESKYFLALNDGTEGVKAGEKFPHDAAKYKIIPVVGDPRRLNTTLIPYDEVNKGAIVYDAKASRDLKPGEPIFFSDIAEDTPRYDTLGPFTLLSVGDQLTGRVEESSRAEGSVVTIQPGYETTSAKGKIFNEDTRRLIQIIDAQTRKVNGTPSYLRIVQVIAHPTTGKAPGREASTAVKVFQADDAIFVPLTNAKVSGVLQIGTTVSFLVPAYP